MQRRFEVAKCWDEVVVDGQGRSNVHGRGEDVIRGLAGVDVVVGVHAHPCAIAQARDHFVDIHIGAGARPGLEDIDREGIRVLAVRDLARRVTDRGGLLTRQQAVSRIHARRGRLDQG